MQRILVNILKLVVSLALLGWLVGRAVGDRAFVELSQQPKRWPLLAAATAACLVAVVLTHVRWCLLVRALGLPLPLGAAMRLGFLGYLFNLAPLGMVGGDLLRAVLLVRRLNGHRARTMASIIVDRAIGLYMLSVVASVAIVWTGFWRRGGNFALISFATWAAALFGGIALAFVFVPGATGGRVTPRVARLPNVGHYALQLVMAVRLYQTQPRALAVSALLTMGTHLASIVSVTLLARGLYAQVAPLGDQAVVVPLAAATAVVPLAFGPFELALEFFYQRLGMPLHQGLIVALAWRIASVLVAGIGVVYYLAARQEVAAAIRRSRHDPPHATAELAPRRP